MHERTDKVNLPELKRQILEHQMVATALLQAMEQSQTPISRLLHMELHNHPIIMLYPYPHHQVQDQQYLHYQLQIPIMVNYIEQTHPLLVRMTPPMPLLPLRLQQWMKEVDSFHPTTTSS